MVQARWHDSARPLLPHSQDVAVTHQTPAPQAPPAATPRWLERAAHPVGLTLRPGLRQSDDEDA